jgi:hypothetical protein
MKPKAWYVILLLVCGTIGALAFGFSGGRLSFDLGGAGALEAAIFIFGWGCLLSPIYLAPWGLGLWKKE